MRRPAPPRQRSILATHRAAWALAQSCMALWAVNAQSARCPEGKPLAGDLGIGGFQCVAAGCAVNLLSDGRYRHEFTVEPYVHAIDSAGPSAGKLREWDRLVAIDNALVTTIEGGDRLANLTAGTAVSLVVRRGGALVRVVVTPTAGCNVPSLAVTRRDVRRPGRF